MWMMRSGDLTAPHPLGTRTGEKRLLRTGSQGPRPGSTESADLLDPRGQVLHEVVHRPVLPDHPVDLRVGVNDGRVVASAELLADLRQRRVGELAREVHR